MNEQGRMFAGNGVKHGVFPLWGMMSGIVIGFFSGLAFVTWWFGPDDYIHSMALIHEGAGVIIGGLIGGIVGLIYKVNGKSNSGG